MSNDLQRFVTRVCSGVNTFCDWNDHRSGRGCSLERRRRDASAQDLIWITGPFYRDSRLFYSFSKCKGRISFGTLFSIIDLHLQRIFVFHFLIIVWFYNLIHLIRRRCFFVFDFIELWWTIYPKKYTTYVNSLKQICNLRPWENEKFLQEQGFRKATCRSLEKFR